MVGVNIQVSTQVQPDSSYISMILFVKIFITLFNFLLIGLFWFYTFSWVGFGNCVFFRNLNILSKLFIGIKFIVFSFNPLNVCMIGSDVPVFIYKFVSSYLFYKKWNI